MTERSDTVTQTAPVPSFADEESGERSMAFICSKGTLDMAYPGLIMANGALGEGIETHLFFTFWGLDMINKKTWEHLHFTPLGNPATHMPQGIGGFPGVTAFATRMLKRQMADLGVPEVPDFLRMLVDMGAHLWACKLTVDMMGLTKDDFFEGVEGILPVSEFIEKTAGAQILFI